MHLLLFIFNIYTAKRIRFKQRLFWCKGKKNAKNNNPKRMENKWKRLKSGCKEPEEKPLHLYDTSDNTSIFSFIKFKDGVIDPTKVPKINRPKKNVKTAKLSESNSCNLVITDQSTSEINKNASIDKFMKKKEELKNFDPPKKKIQMRLKGDFGIITTNQNVLHQYNSDSSWSEEQPKHEPASSGLLIKHIKNFENKNDI